MRALQDIAAERLRQKEVEGWTPEHDDGHDDGALADAAACYASGGIPLAPLAEGSKQYVPLWPWSAEWWKPTDRRGDLVKAGALVIAEIERLDRLAGGGAVEPVSDTFQARNAAWMADAFQDDPTDLPERIARFGEEALELQQALGQSREDAHALVDYVFDRPTGEPAQEMGGTMTTLALLAVVAGLNMAECGERELARCSTAAVLAKIRGKRATRAGRGPLPGLAPVAKRYVAAPEVRRSHSG